MNKTRDLNSLSWMPLNVPISMRIWERGFYIKRDVIKYRHGFKRKAIYWKTTMGILFYMLIFLFIAAIFSLHFLDIVYESLMMLRTLLVLIAIVYVIAYHRAEYTEFNLKKDSVTGLRCYRENCYGDEDCLDFLFPRSTRAAISRPRCLDCTSLELNDIISVLIYNNNKSLFSLGVSCFFVVASGCLQSNMILLDRFAYHEEDHLNDYIDGVKAIIGRKVWVDESEK